MNHGPQMHGPVVAAVLLAALTVAVVWSMLALVRRAGRSAEAWPHDLAVRPAEPGLPAAPSERRSQEAAGATSSAPVLSAENLTKRYGALVAVDGLSFSLHRGSVIGFLGRNGAGKTTTLRLLLGLAHPTEGRALVFGGPYADLERPAQRVGAVLETDDFHPSRSGRDHLRVLALAAGLPAQRVEQVLEAVDLTASATRPVKTYSMGMRRRLGLAAALLGEPELLVLDEPANGLDPVGMRWLRTLLRDFADAGGTVLISSHVLAEVAQAVDRVLIIEQGRLVADAALDELATGSQTLEDAYLALTTGPAR